MQQRVNEEGYMKTIYNLVRCVKLSENFYTLKMLQVTTSVAASCLVLYILKSVLKDINFM